MHIYTYKFLLLQIAIVPFIYKTIQQTAHIRFLCDFHLYFDSMVVTQISDFSFSFNSAAHKNTTHCCRPSKSRSAVRRNVCKTKKDLEHFQALHCYLHSLITVDVPKRTIVKNRNSNTKTSLTQTKLKDNTTAGKQLLIL